MREDRTRDATEEISPDEFDEIHYPRPQATDFEKLPEEMISRRGFLSRGAAFAAAAFVMSAGAITRDDGGTIG